MSDSITPNSGIEAIKAAFHRVCSLTTEQNDIARILRSITEEDGGLSPDMYMKIDLDHTKSSGAGRIPVTIERRMRNIVFELLKERAKEISLALDGMEAVGSILIPPKEEGPAEPASPSRSDPDLGLPSLPG